MSSWCTQPSLDPAYVRNIFPCNTKSFCLIQQTPHSSRLSASQPTHLTVEAHTMELILSQSFGERLWDIGTAISHFTSIHPFTRVVAYLFLSVYFMGVIWGLCVLCMRMGELSTIEWLPPIFTTDGILVCCCPLAVILPIIFWPLMLLAIILRRIFIWFLAAPTYCGIPRKRCGVCLGAFIRIPIFYVDRIWQWHLSRREERQRQGTLPTTHQSSPRSSPSYGTMNDSGPSAGQYVSGQLPSTWSNTSSTWSTPPPYRP